MRIDAHQHFWKFEPVRDSWITDEMNIIRKDFLPDELQTLLERNGFDGSVVVQCSHTEQENAFHLDNAAQYDFIKGIVGWVDLQAENIEEKLSAYSSFKEMKGFRHVLQAEADRAFMLRRSFMNGIATLEKFGFTYDILIFPDQLEYIPRFVAAFPNQKFVVDHIAKPAIKNKETEHWEKNIRIIARHENVYCKISGMVTEADWKNWKQEDFVPYLDTVVDAFGINRIMFGSDWPVCLVASSYEKVVGIVQQYFSKFSQAEQELFFGKNAIQFYDL